MKTYSRVALVAVSLILAAIAMTVAVFVIGARPSHGARDMVGEVPTTINYQGHLTDESGNPVDEATKLKFDLFDSELGGSAIWTETHDSVDVRNGYFAVQLGTNNPFSADDFIIPAGKSTLYLQVSIVDPSNGTVSLPRQPLASVPYAFQADYAAGAPWGGLTGVPPGFADNIDDIDYGNVVVVAKSGGPFTSIQAAIDSINDASAENRYLVWVAPGTYTEQVKLKPGIHLVGAGKWLTFIESAVGNEDIYPPTEATLHLDDYTDVRDLTVSNTGDNFRNVAILVPDGCQHNTLKDVSAETNGLADMNYGIFIHGTNTYVGLEDVNGYAFAANTVNVGVEVAQGASAWFQNGGYSGFNGDWAIGIAGRDEGTHLELSGVKAEGADSNDSAVGLDLSRRASARVQGGSFEARNGYTATMGIGLWDSASLEAANLAAIGQDSPQWNHGIRIEASTGNLNGGSFTGRGGAETYGILTVDGSSLEAAGITTLGEGGTDRNDGLRNESGSAVVVTGGSLRGRGGTDNRGAASYDQNSILDLNQVTAFGEDGSISMGVSNESDSQAFISNSELWGTTVSLFADGAMTTARLSSLIGGSVGGTDGPLCLAVTWGGAFFPDTCPSS